MQSEYEKKKKSDNYKSKIILVLLAMILCGAFVCLVYSCKNFIDCKNELEDKVKYKCKNISNQFPGANIDCNRPEFKL